MSPGVARGALVVVVVAAGAAVWVSRASSSEDIVELRRIVTASELPVEASSAPTVEAAGWINTDPLTDADLAGKVVLYDFWTFGCINCRHTIPYVKAWHERYAADGLIVLSIHTPEFDWEADPDAVAEFVAEEGITYPVALDPDKRTWRRFENHWWPAFYLHDDQGQRRYRHVGEGRYVETEDAIRALLGVDADAPRAEPPRVSDIADHVALFGAGVASFLAPCVVPLMPAYVGMMAGEIGGAPSVDPTDVTAPRAGAVARAGVIFVAGFSAVFVSLGAFAGQLGSSLESFQLWVQRVGGVMVVCFGLVLVGVGRRWVPERRFLARIPATGHVARPLVMGVAFGAAWTPCVGPLLGAALIVAARAADPLHGASLLGAYALGVGAPFVAAALAVESWPTRLVRLRQLSARMEPAAGAVLVVLGVLLLTGTYARILGPLARVFPGTS